LRAVHPDAGRTDVRHFTKPLYFNVEVDTVPNFMLTGVVYKEFEPMAGLSLAVRELEK